MKNRPLKAIPAPEKFIQASRNAQDHRMGWKTIVLPYAVGVNRAYGLGVIGKRAMMYPTAEAKRFKSYVEAICLAMQWRPLAGDVQVLVDLYRERKAGDVDVVKLLADSLEGFAYVNDRQICGLCINRYDDPNFPRCVVSVRLKSGETLNFSEFMT